MTFTSFQFKHTLSAFFLRKTSSLWLSRSKVPSLLDNPRVRICSSSSGMSSKKSPSPPVKRRWPAKASPGQEDRHMEVKENKAERARGSSHLINKKWSSKASPDHKSMEVQESKGEGVSGSKGKTPSPPMKKKSLTKTSPDHEDNNMEVEESKAKVVGDSKGEDGKTPSPSLEKELPSPDHENHSMEVEESKAKVVSDLKGDDGKDPSPPIEKESPTKASLEHEDHSVEVVGDSKAKVVGDSKGDEEKTPSSPTERRSPSKESPDHSMEVEGSTVSGSKGDDDSVADGIMSRTYTIGTNSEIDSSEKDSDWDKSQLSKVEEERRDRRGREGGSVGDTTTPESSEYSTSTSSSSKGEGGSRESEGSQQSFFSRLAGKTLPSIGNRLVSRFWKEMPIEDLPRKMPPTCEPVPWLDQKISVWRGDITHLEIDAIVNAANTSLMGGGGVDGAIHSAAGPGLLAECETLGGCKTGQTKMTSGYRLPARYVLHTVGPMNRDKLRLESCYKTCLKIVKNNGIRSVAFPCVSTGIYGYPNDEAAEIAIATVKKWLDKNDDKVDRIIFCVFLEKDVKIYRRRLYHYFPPCSSEAQKEALLSGRAQYLEDVRAGAMTGSSEMPFTVSEEKEATVTSSMAGSDWTTSGDAGGEEERGVAPDVGETKEGGGGGETEGGGGGREKTEGGGGSVWGARDETKESSVLGEEDNKNEDEDTKKETQV